MQPKQRLIWLVLCVFVSWGGLVSAQVVGIPDPNLRAAVREKLELAEDAPLTKAEMERLTDLGARSRGIVNLTGLEYATNLRGLTLSNNPISDVSPLAELTQLEYLSLRGCQVSGLSPLASLTQLEILSVESNKQVVDISPLKGLTQLRQLNLHDNKIVDISPLANLIDLVKLLLSANRIVDISPLANLMSLVELRLSENHIVDISSLKGLTQLEYLSLEHNDIVDYSPLDGLNIPHLSVDTLCLAPSRPVTPRLARRGFPSVFAAWGGFGWSPVSNLPELSDAEHIALHDVWWSPRFNMQWRFTTDGVKLMGDGVTAKAKYDEVVSLNPDIIILCQIGMRAVGIDNFYREDFPYWLKDDLGQPVRDDYGDGYFLDFTQSGMQDVIVEQVVAVAECGLYDGVFFDYWAEHKPVLFDYRVNRSIGYHGNEAEQQARDIIMERIRAEVGDDFLIICNNNRRKPTRNARHINGTFMETGRDHDEGYTPKGLMQIESTLQWAEANLRSPQVNCLEGYNVKDEPPDTLIARQWMRVFTTMSLTLSDGLVLFRTHNSMGHDHHWYDFYDADLGRPVGKKAQQYENIDGLFIREFTNGWAVYNRSGAEQAITLTQSTTGVSSGETNTTHQLPDLDGEIYLKARDPADVNGDGVVNILDLVEVSNEFGKSTPDPNGDGVVNVLDLVFVTKHFSQ